MGFFTFIVFLVPIGIFFLVLFFINKWVMNSINVRKEQNEVLKDLVKAWERKQNL